MKLQVVVEVLMQLTEQLFVSDDPVNLTNYHHFPLSRPNPSPAVFVAISLHSSQAKPRLGPVRALVTL